MQIRVGYDMHYDCPASTPMIVMLNVHYTRVSDLVSPDHLSTHPSVPMSAYRDGFGNWCTRLVAPSGGIRLSSSAIVRDSGNLDLVAPAAAQFSVPDLPQDVLVFLLPSRYCESDLLSETAWSLFETSAAGWPRVQAICAFVHDHISFSYADARVTRTASEVFRERVGVCRDFAHLAVTLCRCMNIPARYCTGYLSDVGVPPPHAPMDFAAWLEVYLGGRWYTLDPRNYVPRRGRILIARGRDAADVPISSSFGATTLKHFEVFTEEVRGEGLGA